MEAAGATIVTDSQTQDRSFNLNIPAFLSNFRSSKIGKEWARKG